MRHFLLALAAIAVSGCSTRPIVTDVSGEQKIINGVPFRLTADHVVRIYRLSDDTDEYQLVSQTNQRLADLRRLYAISFQGDTFATRSLHLVENADNTLSKMELSATDNAASTLDAVSNALTNRQTADAAKKASDLTNAKAILDADKAVRDAQKDLDGLPSTASDETRALYEQILTSAKQAAAAARSVAAK